MAGTPERRVRGQGRTEGPRRALLHRRVFELYDAEATAANIRRLFVDTLPKKVGARDSLLVFYAGHGQLDATKTGFWIAADGSQDPYAQNNWIPNAQLRNMIGGLKAQRILILADACFSGDFLNVSRSAAPVIDNAYYRRALQLTARQALTSGASEAVPDESEFGRQLINLLERNDEPFLDPVAMYERIRRGVTKTLPLLGTMPGNEEGASFVLFLKGAAGTVTATGQATTSYAPVTGTADLMVKVEGAQGAEVFVDGVSYGRAPVLVKKLEAGRPHKLSARTPTMSGSLDLTLEPGELREMSLSLSALTGNLYVTANEGALELWIDGERKGGLGSGLFKALSVGTKKIELRGQNLYGSGTVTVAAGETAEARILVRPVGSLRIEAPEGVPIKMQIEGWSAERRGGGAIADVPAGTLSLSAGGEGFLPVRGSVTVPKGGTASWRPYSGGAIELSLSPVDCLVAIDDAVVRPGAAGLVAEVQPGQRQLTIRKDGYREKSIAVSVTLGRAAKVEAALELLSPASIRFPPTVTELSLRSHSSGQANLGPGSTAASSIYLVPAGLDLSLTFESPYAERIDLPPVAATLSEGESRSLDILTGRFALPWIPAEGQVSLVGRWELALESDDASGFRSPPLPPGEYRVQVRSSVSALSYNGLVTVIAGSTGEPAGYRETMSAGLEAERLGYEKQLSAKRGKTTAGWVSLIAGAAGAIGSVAVYNLGAEAMEAYRSALDAETAAERWATVSSYQGLFPVVAALGGLGFGLSPILLLGGPDPRALQNSIEALDEAIRALGK